MKSPEWAKEQGLPDAEEISRLAGIGRTAALWRLRQCRAGKIDRKQLTETRREAHRRTEAAIREAKKFWYGGNAEWRALSNRRNRHESY